MIVQEDGLSFPRPADLWRRGWTEMIAGNELVGDGLRIIAILLLAFISYHAIKLLTRRLQRDVAEDDPVVKRRREQRSKTLASLSHNVGMIVVVTVTGLTVLSTFIDIAPLLATAGIAGLAISFGAQSLVKDIISGAFILIEGQFGVADVVRVGDTAGLVEKVTLRTTVLRDIYGVVHVIPNGEIATLSNMTKGWSRAVVDVTVAYREDVDWVIDVLDEIGRGLFADPEWGPLLLEEPEVPGVERLGESGVTIRIMAKTLPLKQWDVARQFRRRIKRRFDAEGVEIPFPHRTLYWRGDRPLPDDGDRNTHEQPSGRSPAGRRDD